MSNDVEARLRKEIMQKQATLATLEKILIGDTDEMLSQEKIKREMQENNAFLGKIEETLKGYVKIKPDVPLDKQIRTAVSRYKKKIETNQENTKEFKAASEKLQKRLKKIDSEKIPKKTLVALKTKISEFKVLLDETRPFFNNTDSKNLITPGTIAKWRKKYVKTYKNQLSEVEDNHKIELKAAKKELRQARKNKNEFMKVYEDKVNAFTQKIDEFGSNFNKKMESFEKRISSMKKQIPQISTKIQSEKAQITINVSEKMQQIDVGEQKAELKTVYQNEVEKAENIMKKKTEKAIKAIKQEIQNGDSEDEDEEQLSDEDKKRRYLLALNHLKAHMTQYPYKQEVIPKYPGQVL